MRFHHKSLYERNFVKRRLTVTVLWSVQTPGSEPLSTLTLPINLPADVTVRKGDHIDRKRMVELRYNLSIFAESKHCAQGNVRDYTG
jgi:hypothetical protein